jgi:hypothetical protein
MLQVIMKSLFVAICVLVLFANQSSAVVVGGFPGLDKMIEQSEVVAVVRIEPPPANTNGFVIRAYFDHWELYDCLVMRLLKGTVPEKRNLKLLLCGAVTGWPYSFAVGNTYIVFLNKDAHGGCDFRAPAIFGAVMRVSPFNHEKEPKGDTVLEKVAHVVREGRDFCKNLHDREQRVFSTVLGEPLPFLSIPLPATPAPKR